MMIDLPSEQDFIALCDLLKLAGLAESGAAAKHVIAEGRVSVDGTTETRKRFKVRRGQVVQLDGVEEAVAIQNAPDPTHDGRTA